ARDRAGDGARARERGAVREGRMTETAPIRQREGSALDRYCLCESYARATERAALAGARWLGRADQEGAERDSAEAMRSALEHLPIDGQVVIGGPEDEALGRGQQVGAGGELVDLALDPLDRKSTRLNSSHV